MESPARIEDWVAGYDARHKGEGVSLDLIRFDYEAREDREFARPDAYVFDLCLTPRPAGIRAGFPKHWGPHRFEAIGDLFLLPPGEILRVRSTGRTRQTSIMCELARERVECWLDTVPQWTDRRLEAALDLQQAGIRSALARLAAEIRQPGPASEALIEALLLELAVQTARHCMAVLDEPLAGGLAGWRLRLVEERLADCSRTPTLRELAELCNISVRQLTRGYRVSRGHPIGDTLAQRRIDTAKRLLDGDRSIKEVAYATGFASPSAFSAAFRRATGMTPRSFRQRMLRPLR